MKLSSASLGLKLNLALLAFVLALGIATSAIVLYGFNRTQDNATQTSEEALEEQGKLALQALIGGVSDAGALQFESAAEAGQDASRYMQDFRASGATANYDVSRFVQTADGVWYDPDPNRISDVVVVNHGQLEGEVLDDIAYSAALDSLYPALTEGFPGELSGEAYHPIAITFVSVAGVGRAYPPIGIQNNTPPEVPVDTFYDRFGPPANPDRETVWSVPYEDLQGRGLVMTAQTPIYEGDEFVGLFEVDLSIAKLVDLVNTLTPTQTGFTFYVDAEGGILQTDSYEFLSTEAETNPALAATLEAMKDAPQEDRPPVEKLTMGGQEYFVAYTPMEMPGGSLGAAAPVDELTAQAALITEGIEEQGDRTFLIMLAAMGALFIASLAAAGYFNRNLVLTPIRKLSTATQAVAAGDLDTKVALNRGDELGTLADSFDVMVEKLRDSERSLERQVEERTAELKALIEISRTLATAQNLRSLVDTILAEMKSVIDYAGASVVLIRESEMEIVESVGPSGREAASGFTGSIDRDAGLWRQILSGEPVILRDARSEEPLAVDFRALTANFNLPADTYIRSWMAVPLTLEDRVVGMLTMSHQTTDYFTAHHVELAQTVARQAAVVADNAQLLEQTQRTAREQQSLAEVSRAVTSSLDLPMVLNIVLEELASFVDYAGAGVTLRDGDVFRQVAVKRPRGPSEASANANDTVPAAALETFRELSGVSFPTKPGEFLLIDDVHDGSPMAMGYRALNGDVADTVRGYQRSVMGLPLVVRDTLVGYLMVAHDEPGYLKASHAELLRPFAEQAAIAIQNAQLFEQAGARTQELSALLEVSRAVSSTIELNPMLNAVLDELRAAVAFDGVSVSLFAGEEVHQVVVRRPPEHSSGDSTHVSPRATYGALEERLRVGQVINIVDTLDDSPEATAFRSSWGGDLAGTTAEWVGSMIVVPLIGRDEMIGTMALGNCRPHAFTARDIAIVQSAVGQVAAAIENARLFEQTRARTRELTAILEVSRTMSSTLDVGQVMETILDQLPNIIEHTGSSLLTVEGNVLRIRAARAIENATAELGLEIPLDDAGVIWERMAGQDHVIIDDIRADDPLATEFRRVIGHLGMMEQPPFNLIRSWMSVPLTFTDRPIGMLTISRDIPAYFTEEHARLASVFAAQAAIALENARLFEQAQGVAALEERQRLARELHDSVSQALYGIALGARTAKTQLERDPTKAAEPVEYILSLAEAGLAEMRSLIFELRPESMAQEGLVAALDKQVAAGRARYGIAIDADICAEPDASLQVKEALYRIAQEALHNIVKHARATQVSLTLAQENGRLTLRVADDGAGFDPGKDYAGHLGLKSMRERAALLGGTLEIDSSTGEGTTIVAELPAA